MAKKKKLPTKAVSVYLNEVELNCVDTINNLYIKHNTGKSDFFKTLLSNYMSWLLETEEDENKLEQLKATGFTKKYIRLSPTELLQYFEDLETVEHNKIIIENQQHKLQELNKQIEQAQAIIDQAKLTGNKVVVTSEKATKTQDKDELPPHNKELRAVDVFELYDTYDNKRIVKNFAISNTRKSYDLLNEKLKKEGLELIDSHSKYFKAFDEQSVILNVTKHYTDEELKEIRQRSREFVEQTATKKIEELTKKLNKQQEDKSKIDELLAKRLEKYALPTTEQPKPLDNTTNEQQNTSEQAIEIDVTFRHDNGEIVKFVEGIVIGFETEEQLKSSNVGDTLVNTINEYLEEYDLITLDEPSYYKEKLSENLENNDFSIDVFVG